MKQSTKAILDTIHLHPLISSWIGRTIELVRSAEDTDDLDNIITYIATDLEEDYNAASHKVVDFLEKLYGRIEFELIAEELVEHVVEDLRTEEAIRETEDSLKGEI